ncbi:MAG: hypothetical protein HY897_20275 [Deltaproteobacteria bacterium]|nr:hypothetical protein [Deltaproteobacteria bacterium]
MTRMIAVAAFLLLSLAACRTIPVAGECPGAAELKCPTEKVCSLDLERDCMDCVCSQPEGQFVPDLDQPNPDETNRAGDPIQD